MKCHTPSCSAESSARVYWPGRTFDACGFCALTAINVATAMGFDLTVLTVEPLRPAGVCRGCGCTIDRACLTDVDTGELVDVDVGDTLDGSVSPCYWVEPDLCSACVRPADRPPPLLIDATGRPLRGAP